MRERWSQSLCVSFRYLIGLKTTERKQEVSSVMFCYVSPPPPGRPTSHIKRVIEELELELDLYNVSWFIVTHPVSAQKNDDKMVRLYSL